MKLSLYTINTSYSDYLRYYDKRVRTEHGDHNRPYVGIIYQTEDIKYFIPLSSKNDLNLSRQMFIDLRIYDSSIKGSMLINNAIPVNKEFSLIKFNEQEDKYKSILLKEKNIIRSEDFGSELANKFNRLHNLKGTNHFLTNFCCDWEKLEKAARNYDYIINNSLLVSKINNNELMLDQADPHIINHIIKDGEGNIIEKKPTLKLVDGDLSVNPDYNYAHLEESMYQDMVDNIKKGEGKANQLITPNKTKDNNYER